MSSSHSSGNISRVCTTRARKNAKHIHRIAPNITSRDTKGGITSIIPLDTLGRLHTIDNPEEVIHDKELARVLNKTKIPRPTNRVSGPLFSGNLILYK